MGIDVDSKLLVGWLITYDQLIKWANKNELPCDDLCCDIQCWGEFPDKYKDWTVGLVSPKFNCEYEEMQYFVTALLPNNDKFGEKGIILKELEEWLTPERIARGKNLALDIGVSENEELQIATLLDISV